MNTRSLWSATTTLPAYPALTTDLTVDVAIVGAGITGLTTALLLARDGKRVAVIDAEHIGAGETGQTTAHLATTLDIHYKDIISKFGRGEAHLIHESRRFALDEIAHFARTHECGFQEVDQYLFATDDKQRAELQEEAKQAASIGVEADFVTEVPLAFAKFGAMRVRRQAQLQPLVYLRALAEAFVGAGGAIYEHTRATDISDKAVTTAAGKISAAHIVVAANVPINDRFLLQTKLAAYRTYAVAAPMADAPVGLFFDDEDPYHYIRSQDVDGTRYLIVGGEDHKTGHETDTESCFQSLQAYVREHFPTAQPISHRWSGQVIEPVDGLPYIGLNPFSQRVFIATGFSGDGITSGTLAGFIINDAIAGRENEFADLYRPSRLDVMASAKEFVKENVDTPATLVADRVRRAEALASVARGEGKIVRSHGERVAAYRDESDGLHLFSPVCPHMGCYVKWNNAEKSWDCPCHGSRFACVSGEVLNGPAIAPLSKVTEKDEKATPASAKP